MKLDFMIAGTAKGGTSSLHNYLKQHPKIEMSNPKELQFFSKDQYFQGDEPDYDTYHSHFDQSRQGVLFAESSPDYTYAPKAVPRIWHYNRNIKLIVLLRNPIDSAYSLWAMRKRANLEDLPFFEALQAEAQRLRDRAPWWNWQHSYMDRCYYSEQIRRIDRFFPRSQVLYLKSEWFFEDPGAQVQKVFAFLGLEGMPVDTQKVFNHSPERNPIAPEEEAYLAEKFRWEVKEIESLLKWDCSDWCAQSASSVGGVRRRRTVG